MKKKNAASEHSPICNPDVVSREAESGGALLFNPDTDQIRMVNATGLFIWKRCDGTHDVPAIVAAIKESFEGFSEAEVETQVKAFIDDMQANGFVGVPEDVEESA